MFLSSPVYVKERFPANENSLFLSVSSKYIC
jgi:hypothetical protein